MVFASLSVLLGCAPSNSIETVAWEATVASLKTPSTAKKVQVSKTEVIDPNRKLNEFLNESKELKISWVHLAVSASRWESGTGSPYKSPEESLGHITNYLPDEDRHWVIEAFKKKSSHKEINAYFLNVQDSLIRKVYGVDTSDLLKKMKLFEVRVIYDAQNLFGATVRGESIVLVADEIPRRSEPLVLNVH
jgi:hypothetical protein